MLWKVKFLGLHKKESFFFVAQKTNKQTKKETKETEKYFELLFVIVILDFSANFSVFWHSFIYLFFSWIHVPNLKLSLR